MVNVNVFENNVSSLLLHKFNEIFVKIWENYGTIFCHRLAVNEGRHSFLYPSSWSDSIKRFKMAVIIRCDLDVSEISSWLLYNCSRRV